MTSRAFTRWFSYLLVGAVTVLAGIAQADENWKQNSNSKAATEAQACVKETPWMRRNHMDLIKHDRNITVHQGVRTIKGSLKGCVACHANKDEQGAYIPVVDSEQFCADCHQAAGVTLDCFSCHKTVPEDTGGLDASALLEASPSHARILSSDAVQTAGN